MLPPFRIIVNNVFPAWTLILSSDWHLESQQAQ
jgi:hypothetical protein